jgi:hypothetical protein
LNRYREKTRNLRTQLQKTIRRAGLKLRSIFWQNLYSTLKAELAEQFPMHVVCAWIGNSQPVVVKHYPHVTDEHFSLAAEGGGEEL